LGIVLYLSSCLFLFAVYPMESCWCVIIALNLLRTVFQDLTK
jgi:hypothetical protein